MVFQYQYKCFEIQEMVGLPHYGTSNNDKITESTIVSFSMVNGETAYGSHKADILSGDDVHRGMVTTAFLAAQVMTFFMVLKTTSCLVAAARCLCS